MQSTRTLSDKIWLVLKGIGMGAANKVPGVSGGVVAFVAGFYEEFIYSLQKINKTAFLLLIKGRWKSFYQYINGTFLSLLMLGIVISYFSISKVLDYLLIHYELYVWGLFFGLIIGSVLYLAINFGPEKKKYLPYILLGIAAGASISFLSPAKENSNLLFVFFCGIISVSGMTIPGLSGSFLIMLMGNYVLLLVDAVNALFDTIAEVVIWDFSFLTNEPRIHLLQVLIVFTLGSIVGLVSLSHLLTYVLKRYKKATFAVIIGFITGSLGVVWPWKKAIYVREETGLSKLDHEEIPIITGFERYFPKEWTTENILTIGMIILGIGVIIALEKYGNYKKNEKG